LPTTLHHILAQEFPKDIDWEVLIIDNASTDGTSDIAFRTWMDAVHDDRHLRIVYESQLGIGIARYRAISEAQYEFICFIDDDNWVDKCYAITALKVMTGDSAIAVCGSLNDATSDQSLPPWFEAFQRSFAVGPQSECGGDVTNKRGVLWSAGMVLRKSAIDDLLDSGFEPKVKGAQGQKSLLRSEDYELCLALKLRGWKLWYEPTMKLRHYLPQERLDWMYLRRLLRGVGESDIGLLPYYYAQNRSFRPPKLLWTRLFLSTLKNMVPRAHKFLLMKYCRFEGDASVLQLERSVGLLKSLTRQKNQFDLRTKRLVEAGWIKI
jgi:glycosyltransferase involved in cell wall biosynthesis